MYESSRSLQAWTEVLWRVVLGPEYERLKAEREELTRRQAERRQKDKEVEG